VKFQILGPLEVMTSTGPLAISAKRLRALLALLLLDARAVVSADRLIDGIWPGQPPPSALENVRTYVSQLRALFSSTDGGPARAECPARQSRLQTHPAGYRLLVEPEELDLLRFDAMATAGSRALAAGNDVSAGAFLGQAVELWRGTPLPELVLGPSAQAKIVAVEERYRQVQTEWIRARLGLGHHAELLPLLCQLIEERPCDEGLRAMLMSALYRAGRSGEALTAFVNARNTLIRELGVEPGAELRQIQAAILSGNPVTPRPLAAAQAVATSYATVPHHLPAIGPVLIGRDRELDAVTALADPADSNSERAAVLAMSGPPGAGKTATAVAAAAKVAAAYPAGQLYLDLGGSTERPVTAGEAIARLLTGLGFSIGPETAAAQAEECQLLYRSLLAERRMVVVLDDAVDAAQVRPLIPGQGPSLVIVTSRRYLAGVGCTIRLNLDPLPTADGLHLLGSIIGVSRVAAEHGAACAIVLACGGLPLAIEIAGTRLAALSRHPLQFLADRLAVRDRLLDELSVDGLSLTPLFAASYGRLDEQARLCFRAIGLLDPNHITGDVLAEPLHLPARLADRHLERLVYEGLLQTTGADEYGSRYRMPTVLHAYARTQLTIEGIEPLTCRASA
jgi:DNA-binding SARP family transcriptional activator